jgi:2'-5' RNA ligase
VIVPVPEAEDALMAWPGESASLKAAGMPFHVTVLYPFLPDALIDTQVERTLAQIAASRARFEFQLSALGRFANVLFIAPRPSDPFVALIDAVYARWPGYPPYKGEFDQTVPHVTLASRPEPAGLARAVECELPIAAVARELCLLVRQTDGVWVTRNRFPLCEAEPPQAAEPRSTPASLTSER